MKRFATLARLSVPVLAGVLLASCSLLNGPWRAEKKAPPPPVAVEPAVPMPVPTHKFEITPDQDIVGVLQVTRSTKEDTLSDIARRFDVGYEEIYPISSARLEQST